MNRRHCFFVCFVFCDKGVYYTDRCPVNHTTKSAALFRLLTRTIEAPKKGNMTVRVTNTQNEKAENIDSEKNIPFKKVKRHSVL